MVGYIVEARSEALHVDKAELEDAQWFSREYVRSELAKQGDSDSPAEDGGFHVPTNLAARTIMRAGWTKVTIEPPQSTPVLPPVIHCEGGRLVCTRQVTARTQSRISTCESQSLSSLKVAARARRPRADGGTGVGTRREAWCEVDPLSSTARAGARRTCIFCLVRLYVNRTVQNTCCWTRTYGS